MEKPVQVFLWSGGGVLCFLLSVGFAVSWGSVDIPLSSVWQAIGHRFFPFIEVEPATEAIIWELRLPRVLLAAGVGASLSIAGVIFQGLLQNQLADPYILGVSSGSAAGAVIAIVIGLSAATISVFAFIGACLAVGLVLQLAQDGKQIAVHRLILSGVVIQSFFGAMVSFLLSISYSKVQTIVYWLLGSFSLSEWKDVWLITSLFSLGFVVAWLLSRKLNILALGERPAKHLGLSVDRLRIILLMIASLLTAMSVSVSGTIGFVGLVIPHITRLLIGSDHRFLLPSSALLGAVFLIGTDCLARTILSPSELPVGVITAMVGAPFFAFLLRKLQRNTHLQ